MSKDLNESMDPNIEGQTIIENENEFEKEQFGDQEDREGIGEAIRHNASPVSPKLSLKPRSPSLTLRKWREKALENKMMNQSQNSPKAMIKKKKPSSSKTKPKIGISPKQQTIMKYIQISRVSKEVPRVKTNMDCLVSEPSEEAKDSMLSTVCNSIGKEGNPVENSITAV